MPSIIVTPSEIEHPLYEEHMELSSGEGRRRSEETPVSMPGPVVTLGKPQWWNMSKLARERGEQLPPELLLMHEADFYLVQLACSFRPSKDSQVEWAQFNVYLRPHKAGQQDPIAFDLYPREIYNETKTDVKVSIAPSLKFTEVEGQLGEVVTTIEFKRLEPIVVGFGALESVPSWEFEKHKEYPLRGSKFSYIIVKKAHGMQAVRLTMDIVAEVNTQRGLLSGRVTRKGRSHLTQLVCTK